MSYLPQKFQTSFMDIILGTLGAFFLLLIIISTNRRGEQQKGSQLPGNILSIAVKDEEFNTLEFYKHIGFWVGIIENDKLEAVWFSDETKEGNANCKDKIDINRRLLRCW